MKRFFSIIGWMILVCFLITGCGKKVELAATVNGDKITVPELQSRMEQVAAMYGMDLTSEEGKSMADYLQDQVLQSMIEEKTVLQEAVRRKISVTQEEVNTELQNTKKQFPADQEYQNFLKERKFTEQDLDTYVRNQLILNKLFDEVTKDITSSAKDPQQYYNENKEEFKVEEQVKARNIVVKTEDEAKTVIARLDKGEDFAKVAVEVSIDPTVKQNQGLIIMPPNNDGYFDKNAQLVPEFIDAAFALNKGEYTKKPVKSTYGYHIIKVEDKKPAQQQTFEQVKQQLIDRFIMEDKNDKFSKFVDDLLAKSKIDKKIQPKQTTDQGANGGQQSGQPQTTQPQTNQPQQNGQTSGGSTATN